MWMVALGSEKRLPFAPAIRTTVPKLAARPMHTVDIGDWTYCMVSQNAKPAPTAPPAGLRPWAAYEAPLRPSGDPVRGVASHRRRPAGDRAALRRRGRSQPAGVRLFPRAHGGGQGAAAAGRARAVGSRLVAALRDPAGAPARRSGPLVCS